MKLEHEYKSFLDVTLKWFPIATNKKYILFNTVWTEVLQFKDNIGIPETSVCESV